MESSLYCQSFFGGVSNALREEQDQIMEFGSLGQKGVIVGSRLLLAIPLALLILIEGVVRTALRPIVLLVAKMSEKCSDKPTVFYNKYFSSSVKAIKESLVDAGKALLCMPAISSDESRMRASLKKEARELVKPYQEGNPNGYQGDLFTHIKDIFLPWLQARVMGASDKAIALHLVGSAIGQDTEITLEAKVMVREAVSLMRYMLEGDSYEESSSEIIASLFTFMHLVSSLRGDEGSRDLIKALIAVGPRKEWGETLMNSHIIRQIEEALERGQFKEAVLLALPLFKLLRAEEATENIVREGDPSQPVIEKLFQVICKVASSKEEGSKAILAKVIEDVLL